MSLVVPNHLNQIELELKRQTKMRGVYSLTIFVALVLFIIFGFETASDANSGGFLQGFSQLLDFPIDIIKMSFDAGWALLYRLLNTSGPDGNNPHGKWRLSLVSLVLLSAYCKSNLVKIKQLFR